MFFYRAWTVRSGPERATSGPQSLLVSSRLRPSVVVYHAARVGDYQSTNQTLRRHRNSGMAPDTPTAAKRSKQAPCTAASLPEEIVSEILLLLPTRSILRFCAVCRSWGALLSSPAF